MQQPKISFNISPNPTPDTKPKEMCKKTKPTMLINSVPVLPTQDSFIALNITIGWEMNLMSHAVRVYNYYKAEDTFHSQKLNWQSSTRAKPDLVGCEDTG